jgi:hypothetical protein
MEMMQILQMDLEILGGFIIIIDIPMEVIIGALRWLGVGKIMLID